MRRRRKRFKSFRNHTQKHITEKYIAKNKKLYFAFVDLEKAFDRVPREVVWWAMRKLGVDEWIVALVQAMYANAG